jgi:hypothetical protein
MFWFHHPKPFNQKAVAVQIVQRKAAAVRDTTLIIVEQAPQGTASIPSKTVRLSNEIDPPPKRG